MDSSSKSFEDFEPRFDWLHHPESHVLMVHLSGFRSNQLKVHVTSTGKLRITGERRLSSSKSLRLNKEIDVPADADTNKISAKLEEGILYVMQPKKTSAVSSYNRPAQQSKPKAESQPSPAAAKPTVEPPTVRPNTPKSQNERPQSQANGKQIPTSPKPHDAAGAPARAEKSAEKLTEGGGQPVQDLAPKDRTEKETEEKAKAHTKLQDALEKTREKEGEEGGGSKMAKEKEGGGHGRGGKEGGVAEERRRRSEEMVEESGRLGRGEWYKQVIDGMVTELRTNMVTLVMGAAVFVIVYLNLTKKDHVEEEL